MGNASNEFLTTGEVAAKCGCHRQTIYRLTRSGLLPFVQFGRVIAYPPEAITAYRHRPRQHAGRPRKAEVFSR